MRNGPETIPVIGPWISSAGGVMDLWAMPCFPRLDIFAAAAVWNLPRLWWDVVKPSPGNEIRALLRGASHSKLKEKQPIKPKINWLNPSIVEGVGFASFLDGVAESAGQKFSIAVTGEVGFYITIANALADFSLAWITTAYQMGGCLPSDAGPTRLTTGEGSLFLGPGPEAVIFAEVEGDNSLNLVNGIKIPAGLGMSVGAEVNIAPWPAAPEFFGNATAAVVDVTTGTTLKHFPMMGPDTPKKIMKAHTHVKMAPAGFDRKVCLIFSGPPGKACVTDGSSLTAGESHLVASQFKRDP